MDSQEKTTSTKPKQRFVKNLDSKECVRPFKLQRHYPSTLTELRKNEIKKGTGMTQAQGAKNIDVSDNIKIVKTQDVQSSEISNVQKLTLKSVSRKDLGIKLNMQDGKLQTKVLTVPKIIQNSSRFKKLAESSVQELQKGKPTIKNISQVLTLSPSKEQLIKSDDLFPSNTTVQVMNSETNSTLNPNENCSKQIIFQDINTDARGKLVAPNVIYNTQQNPSKYVTLSSLSGFSNFVMVQNSNGQLVTPTLGKLKPVTIVKKNSTLNNQATLKNAGKVIIQAQLSNTSTKKRDSSVLDQTNVTEVKKYRHGMEIDNLAITNTINKSSISKESDQSLDMKNSSNPNANATISKKNIMVIVPNETAKEMSMVSSSSYPIDENLVLHDNSEISIFHENNPTESNHSDTDTQVSNNTKIVSNCIEDEAESNINPTNTHKSPPSSKSENILDKFSILKKAVLSVQDENLRAEALKALQDCGIKTKKKVLVKRPLPTKIINESAVQTNVFSLLKEGEFIEADETHEDLIRIKSSRQFPKTSINTLCATSKNQLQLDKAKYARELDDMIDNRFRNNKNVSDVKNAFLQSQKLKAKYMLDRLQKDFEASKNYDNDGHLGIHRAVINDNLRDVQKQIILLKATKQNIDVCTADGQTSLELAVELEVGSQITKVLLESGAEPVSSKAVHDSAIILAAKKSSRVLPMLLNHIKNSQKILLNAKNSEGFAAIHYCAQSGYLEGVSELIRHGADVNLQDERSGRTALFYAVDTKSNDVSQEVYNEIAQKLVDNGAFSNIPTFSKHSVLTLIDDVKSHSLKIALNRAVR